MARQAGRIPLIGYSDRLTVRPGETIGFKVSSHADAPFEAWLTRSICADPNPDGPGIVEEPFAAAFAGAYPSRVQPFDPGGYALVERGPALPAGEPFAFEALVWPTLPADGREQVVLAAGGVRLMLLQDGRVAARAGGAEAATAAPLKRRRWYRLRLACDPEEGRLAVGWEALATRRADAPRPGEAEEDSIERPPGAETARALSFDPAAPVVIAAALDADGVAIGHYDGKIEAPAILDRHDRPAARWDFARDVETLTVRDVGPSGLDGRLVNLPVRGVTGAGWDGSAFSWREKPEHYGAIHFHSDAIVDFGWEDDFRFTVPEDLPSGIYLARIRCGAAEDAMPFFVPPPKGARAAEVAVLASTFTYAIYGNHARPDFAPFWRDRFTAWDAYPYNPADHPEYGLSTYNRFRDGAGICHASWRRPLFTLRPGYVTFGYGEGSGLRHFPADSHLIAWLHAKDIAYDIVTDEMLDEEGAAALDGYKAVLTGSHPEYHTPAMLDALGAYRDGGGKLAYLGGNGFYWKIVRHAEQPGALEVRRAEGGIRAWPTEPGEAHHAFDGSYGGLWRRLGRAPQLLTGIGFSAQGQFEAAPYRVEAVDPGAPGAWILGDLKPGDLVGDFGLSGGGAAGFELDRVDPDLGSPDGITVLARSAGTGESFVTVPEEMLTHITTVTGEPKEALLRADMTYFETPAGGAVFSVGSITFCGSLPENGFNNPVSALLERVVRGFCAGGGESRA
ncbi:MAG: N,N-dimethylformamidase large subunit [Alphaproteobacteria bacterium]|nr:N,N-dimethylformamidase large subunit [Alphaproteobacteria bacterium]